MKAPASSTQVVSRRDFLKTGAAGSASLVIGFYWGTQSLLDATADAAKGL